MCSKRFRKSWICFGGFSFSNSSRNSAVFSKDVLLLTECSKYALELSELGINKYPSGPYRANKVL